MTLTFSTSTGIVARYSDVADANTKDHPTCFNLVFLSSLSLSLSIILCVTAAAPFGMTMFLIVGDKVDLTQTWGFLSEDLLLSA